MRAYQPVIIIGAGRSGTNILRDVLTSLPEFGTWPCDEINYIWRHGNMRYPTDQFGAELATEPVQRFIGRAFDQLYRTLRTPYLVEKTCANSMRVAFVDRVMPDAKFIFIVRDGRDVVASAMKRWTASLDIPYLAKKVRYVPVSDVPYYGGRYLMNRIYRLRNQEKRLASWGPKFEGMDAMLAQNSLAEVCAAQWQRSVLLATDQFSEIAPERVFRLRYEDFVNSPSLTIAGIARFLGHEISSDTAETITANVTPHSVGKWRQDLTATEVAEIMPFLQPTLGNYGYCSTDYAVSAQTA